MIGLGVVGAGWIGEALIRAAGSVDGLRVIAVQDTDAAVAAAVRDRYGIRWGGTSIEELLEQPDIETVLIATPNALHVPQARAALEAGKDVLVQKPLALTGADARALLTDASALGRRVMVDYSYRFVPTMGCLRAAARDAGAIQAARVSFHNIYGPDRQKSWTRDPRLSGGGALIDLGVHLIDLVSWLLAPAQVRLVEARFDTAPIEQIAFVRFTVDAVPVDLAVSWNAPLEHTQILVELDTAVGPLRWENVAGSFFHFRTTRRGHVLDEGETTLRRETLQALVDDGFEPADVRVYDLIDQAYAVRNVLHYT
jgi:predicted dehydrogenase